MRNLVVIILGIGALLIPQLLFAQIPAKNQLIEIEPGSNLLFVVIIVICVLITGLFLFLFSLDRKIKKLKNNI